MQIPDHPPAIGKAREIDAQFGVWWKFLNSLGVAAFLMFTQCIGLNEWRYLSAIMSGLLVIWGYAYGTRYFPTFVRHLRSQKIAQAKSLEAALWKDYFYRRPWAYFPMFLGFSTLFGLAVFPVFSGNLSAYIPF